jgi:hypothetical protein
MNGPILVRVKNEEKLKRAKGKEEHDRSREVPFEKRTCSSFNTISFQEGALEWPF